MKTPPVKTKAGFVVFLMLLASTLGVPQSSHWGAFTVYGDPDSQMEVSGATPELAGGMLVLCQNTLEYTRTILKDLEDDSALDLEEAWQKIAKAEEHLLLAATRFFEDGEYDSSIQHSKRVLELCEEVGRDECPEFFSGVI